MTHSSPEDLVRGHSSPWVRLVIRTLTIRGATWWLLALALFATAVVSQQAWRTRKETQKASFQAEAAILRNAMLERFHRYGQVLQGVRGLFDACEKIGKSEFRAYADSLLAGHENQGIRAIGYIERVESARTGEFLARSALEHGNSFRIHPSGDRPDYLVVSVVEPLESNRAALGYDIGSEVCRRMTAMSACDSASATLTPRIELVQAPGKASPILLEPVYAGGATPATVAERRARLKGWVYAAFAVGDVLDGVRQIKKSPLEYEIYDGAAVSTENLLCLRGGERQNANVDALQQDSVLEIFHRPWTVRTRAPVSVAGERGILPVWLLSTGGICMSLLIFGVAHSMATTSRRACSLAEGMTSELRHRGEALRASEKRLAMVIMGSNDGIWDWNVVSNEVYFSSRWKGMLGYEDHEIGNTFAAWESLLHPDDRDRANLMINGYLAGNIPSYHLEYRLRHKDGGYRWILSRGVVSRDASGRPVRMAGSHVDLTDLKQAEQELRNANRELQESQARLQDTLADLSASHAELEKTQLELIQAAKLESVGTLAAGVAHEVKNPLQIIIMGLDFLDRQFPAADEATLVTLTDMRDAALRADSITRELLHFSSAGDFDPCPADLEAVVERSLWLLRTDITKSGVTVVKELAGNLPKISIDVSKIQQVLINLIGNALQAMDRSGILTIRTSAGHSGQLSPPDYPTAHPHRTDENLVMLRLHDTGPGIPKDQMHRIFDPFFTTKAVGAGTGLGLSVVKKIIDLHCGIIHFRSSPRGGLEVTLAFAAIRQAATAPPRSGAGGEMNATPNTRQQCKPR